MREGSNPPQSDANTCFHLRTPPAVPMRDSVNSAIVQVTKVTSTGLTVWGREAAVNLGAHYRRRYFLPVSLEAAAETF